MTVSGLKPKLGTKSGYSLSDEAIAALQAGDPTALINFHRRTFGGFVMEEGDDDNSGDGDDGNNDGDSGTGDDGDDGDDGASGSDDDADTKAALERMEKRMKAADQRADKAEKALKAIEDGKKDDLTKATDRVTELEGEVTGLKEQLQSERLNNGFLSANKHTWHNPNAALKLAQSEGYLTDVLNDDGTVDNKALGTALDKLAKDHTYLVKPREGAGASGEPAGGRSGNGKDDKAVKEADKRRAPALARRS
jgi:hypothetical protein